MRTWINMLAALIALCASFISSGLQVDAAEGPNVIFILADDMGYGDVGALNPESKIKTPNLDDRRKIRFYSSNREISIADS